MIIDIDRFTDLNGSLGAEAGDFIVREEIQPDVFINGLLSVMPWADDADGPLHGSKDNVTIVLTYRAPRVDHYVSYWHMAGDPPALRQWTLEMQNQLNALDPLGVAQIYLNHGFKVVILDTSGINSQGVDLSNAVACDVLKVPCEGANVLGNTIPPEVRNHRDDNGMKDLTDQELSQVDHVLNNFDCNYRSLLFHPNLQINYGRLLTQTLANCSQDHETLSRSDMINQLKDIARSGAPTGPIELSTSTTTSSSSTSKKKKKDKKKDKKNKNKDKENDTDPSATTNSS